MSNRVPITIRLDSFEGPLDLLLYLIQSHELDISRVSLTRITDQYLAYVKLMQELNFDIASEFLVMAATLIHWKSRALLPQEEKPGEGDAALEGELTQEDLIRQLMEHQRFLEAGGNIAQLPWLGLDVFSRPNARPPVEKVWRETEITELALTYQDILKRSRSRTQILRKETVSLSQKMMEFSGKLQLGVSTALEELMSIERDRPEVVVTFLASLELARLKKLKLYQEITYEQIYVELVESLSELDLQLANGFDAAGAVQAVDQAATAAAADRSDAPASLDAGGLNG